MKQKLLALAISGAMVFSAVPTVAFADEIEDEIQIAEESGETSDEINESEDESDEEENGMTESDDTESEDSGSGEMVVLSAEKEETLLVTNIWDDDDDKAGARPEELYVTLTSAEGEQYTIVLSEENEWSLVFDEDEFIKGAYIEAFTSDEDSEFFYDEEIEGVEDVCYELREEIPDGYTVSYESEIFDDGSEDGIFAITITNTYFTEEVEEIVEDETEETDDLEQDVEGEINELEDDEQNEVFSEGSDEDIIDTEEEIIVDGQELIDDEIALLDIEEESGLITSDPAETVDTGMTVFYMILSLIAMAGIVLAVRRRQLC